MRRKIPYRVCHCTPDGVVTHLEARLLRDIVNRAIHPIRCAETYHYLYGEKYNSNFYPDLLQMEWDAEMDQYAKDQQTASIFREGQGDE